MATTQLTGRPVHDFSGHVLVLPQGGLPDSAPEGAVTLEGGKVYIRLGQAWNEVGLTPVPTDPVMLVHDARVTGAGSVECNGDYVNQNPDQWEKPDTTFYVSRLANYPTPNIASWTIRQGGNIYYTAPDDEDPWNKTWTPDSFGALPVPTVTKV